MEPDRTDAAERGAEHDQKDGTQGGAKVSRERFERLSADEQENLVHWLHAEKRRRTNPELARPPALRRRTMAHRPMCQKPRFAVWYTG
jgi:hypothetical protein